MKDNRKNVTINTEPLILMASMYDEYLYLDITFVQNHQCLFGVKSELYNTVKANLDAYEGAYILYRAAQKRYHEQLIGNPEKKMQIRLLDWGELLYGETRWSSDEERAEYGIRAYNKYKKKKYKF